MPQVKKEASSAAFEKRRIVCGESGSEDYRGFV
jgi:hypothetical protein